MLTKYDKKGVLDKGVLEKIISESDKNKKKGRKTNESKPKSKENKKD